MTITPSLPQRVRPLRGLLRTFPISLFLVAKVCAKHPEEKVAKREEEVDIAPSINISKPP
jgi:hypothetical protein